MIVTVRHTHTLDPVVVKLLTTIFSTLPAAIEDLKGIIMADAASVLAKITKNTDTLKSAAIALDALKEGQATIADEIAALKAQIATGGTADFSALDAAADEQTTVADGAAAAIGTNATPLPAA